MENQTGLIGQDTLTIAILKAEQEREQKLCESKRELNVELDSDIESYLLNFLRRKHNLNKEKAKFVLSQNTTRLKVEKAALKSLIFGRAVWPFISLGTTVLTLLQFCSFFIWIWWISSSSALDPESVWNQGILAPLTGLFVVLSGMFSLALFAFSFADFGGIIGESTKKKIFCRLFGFDYKSSGYLTELCNRLKIRVTNPETQQKLIE